MRLTSGSARLPRPLLIGLVVVLAVDILGAIGFIIYDAHRRGSDPPRQSDTHARPAPGGEESEWAEDGTETEQQRTATLQRLLDRRARAVRQHDRLAFLATVDPSSSRRLARQERLFRNLVRLPLATYSYRFLPNTWQPAALVPGAGGERAGEQAGKGPPPGKTWTARVLLRYRLSGFDEHTVTRARYLSFRRAPGGAWRVSGRAPGGETEIWDLGSLRAIRNGSALVLGLGSDTDHLRDIARTIDHAVPRVRDVWGRSWSGRSVVLVPATQDQAAELTPDQRELSQIAAVTTVASGPNGVPPAGTGDRIIVNMRNFTKISPQGRRIVLAHELTHVATRAVTGPAIPLWLIEGFADYVGYRGSGVSVHLAAGQLANRVESGSIPKVLPNKRNFSGGPHLARAYEEAWLACRFIANRYGEESLVRLYRTMGSARQGPTPTVQRKALNSVLGMSVSEFTRSWRSYVRGQFQ